MQARTSYITQAESLPDARRCTPRIWQWVRLQCRVGTLNRNGQEIRISKGAEARASLDLTSRSAQKAPRKTSSSELADQLIQRINSGELAEGTSLPSERELIQRFSCSRTTLREALSLLRAQDFIEVRLGRNGGSFVTGPNSASVVRSIDRLIGGHSFRHSDLIIAREAIEAAAAEQAAMNRSEEDLEALRLESVRCEEAQNDPLAFIEANLGWHLALANASANPLLIAFLTSLSRAMHTASDLDEFKPASVQREVTRIHWKIFDAIRDRDPEAARRRILRHLRAYEAKLEIPPLG